MKLRFEQRNAHLGSSQNNQKIVNFIAKTTLINLIALVVSIRVLYLLSNINWYPFSEIIEPYKDVF